MKKARVAPQLTKLRPDSAAEASAVDGARVMGRQVQALHLTTEGVCWRPRMSTLTAVALLAVVIGLYEKFFRQHVKPCC